MPQTISPDSGAPLSLTPAAVELLDYVDDGEATRRYRFRLRDPEAMEVPEPGQFFMLSVPGAGEAPFTYTSVPDGDGVFGGLVRRVGAVTAALFDCRPGAVLGVRGPFGRGWPLAELAGRRVLVVAGGCGLAPLVCLIEQLIDERWCRELALVYGARQRSLQMLNDSRRRWREKISLFDTLDSAGPEALDGALQGTPLVLMDDILQGLGWFPEQLLLCGPEVMMNGLAAFFVERGLPGDSIWLSIERRMHCAVGLCGHCYLTQHHLSHHYTCKDGPTYRWDTLQPIVEAPGL
ncbi:MAG: oxidoreductase [Gammaproteobacteria bacterium]|nr:MAG: oxidoreductase [Gammaproteobacteria bacterium]